MHLNLEQKVCFLNITTFMNFVFISQQDSKPLPCPTMKPYHFDARTTIKMKVEDIKTKFMKVSIFKKKIFYSGFNYKIQDFNTSFSYFSL